MLRTLLHRVAPCGCGSDRSRRHLTYHLRCRRYECHYSQAQRAHWSEGDFFSRITLHSNCRHSTLRMSTPPPQTAAEARSPLTPEQVRRIEISRLKAKALREEREAKAAATANLKRTDSQLGQKRSYDTCAGMPASGTNRDARNDLSRPLEAIQPARNLAKYVDYDLSKMADTKGGFLTAEDDPHNKALHADERDPKPSNMTQKEWERQQLLRSLRDPSGRSFRAWNHCDGGQEDGIVSRM